MKGEQPGRFPATDRDVRPQVGKPAVQDRLHAAGAGIVIRNGCQHLAVGEIHRHVPALGKQLQNPAEVAVVFPGPVFEWAAGAAQNQRKPAVGTDAVVVA